MPAKLVSRQMSSAERSQRLLIGEDSAAHYNVAGKGSRFAEVAGGTAAECAAVCCCCPCGLADLLFLAVYRVPAGLCRNALRRKRQRWLIKRGIIPSRMQRCECGCDDVTDLHFHSFSGGSSPSVMDNVMSAQLDADVVELEKEMWDHFYGAGFGRSISQRITPSPIEA
ncbi:uncharacterized protein LOC124935057 [Impatiens glandulifera]|uniref:uncharacterized protein LOC124935057 n=1 Tax=Impatiens glandulifera TaxID=253017 RepID=UPI001FB0D114|nr:uncharacterized protein LOC124935057 [Impatiens glandulifera]